MTSTLLAGCNAATALVTTTITSMMPSIAAMNVSQRFSVRATTASGTAPSASGRSAGLVGSSANGTPPDEKRGDGNDREGQCPDGASLERLRGRIRLPWRAAVRFGGRRLVRGVDLH